MHFNSINRINPNDDEAMNVRFFFVCHVLNYWFVSLEQRAPDSMSDTDVKEDRGKLRTHSRTDKADNVRNQTKEPRRGHREKSDTVMITQDP
jgi:hypothetical protein